MANQNNNNVYGLIPELGDLVTIITPTSSTTGRITFRNEDTIRVRPYNKPTHGVDFKMDPETLTFLERVDEIIIHEKRKEPQFSKQLAVSRGDLIEFYNLNGEKIGEPKTVFEIYATETDDGLKFDDGSVIDFAFLGVPSGFGALRAVGKPASPEDNSEYEAPEDNVPEIDIEALIRKTALVTEVPSEELVYDDSIQREDMFVSLLSGLLPEQQQNPRIMQNLYRVTDVLLALKNAVRVMPESAATPTARSFTASTVLEALAKQPNFAPVAAVIPVAAIKRVIYGDVENVDNSIHGVEIRKEYGSLGAAISAATLYQNEGAGRGGNFTNYMHNMLKLIESYSAMAEGKQIEVDQEVIRTNVPPEDVQGLPSFEQAFEVKKAKDISTISIHSENITKIRPQMARLLTKSEIINYTQNTKTRVAPADTAETVGHVLASPAFSLRRAPNRSSVLIWDVLESNASRIKNRTFADELESEVKVIDDDDEFTLKSLLAERIPHALSISDKNVSMVIDSLGLRNLEMTPDLMDALDEALIVGQQNWDRDYKKLVAAATQGMAVERAPVVDSIGPIAEFDVEPLHSALQAIKERERLLHTVDIAVINELNKEAEGTLTHIYYGLQSGADENHLNKLKSIYTSENERQQRNVATQYLKSREFTATPEIINCPHVHEYERIMKERNDQKRMILFEKFFGDYQGGQKGNFYMCGTCNTTLVCKHEVLMLNEFKHPKESEQLHKDLLLNYAGPIFEGNYTCKNCGQKIKEIEFDTGMEFDSEGHALAHVIDESGEMEPAEPQAESEDMMIELPFEKDDPFFNTKKNFYEIAKVIMDSINYVAPKDVYERVLNSCIDYFEHKVPKVLPAAALKQFGSKEVHSNTFKIVGLASLILMEFQINNPNIPFEKLDCTLRRDGFPMNGPDEKSGKGAFEYISCAISKITRNYEPWTGAFWSAKSDMAKRQTFVEYFMKIALNEILGLGPKPQELTTVSAMYKKLLADASIRNKSDTILQTDSDLLPPSFRPITRFEKAQGNRKPIGNEELYRGDVQKGDVNTVKGFNKKQETELIHEIIFDFHNSGRSTAILGDIHVRSDSDCCNGSLADIQARGFGITGDSKIDEAKRQELKTLIQSSSAIHHRDPATANAGTHVVVPWSAPPISSELPQPSESSYYQLFLKHCARGPNIGQIHEYDAQTIATETGFTNNYICRHCEFTINDALFLMAHIDNPNDYKEYIRYARELVGNITAENFKELEQQVRSKKRIANLQTPESIKESQMHSVPIIEQIQKLNLLSSLKTEQSKLVDLLYAMSREKLDIDSRKTEFGTTFGDELQTQVNKFKINMHFNKQDIIVDDDSIRNDIWSFIHPRNLSQNKQSIVVDKFSDIVSLITNDKPRPYVKLNIKKGPRVITQFIVVFAEQISKQFSTNNGINNVTIARWFGKNFPRSYADEFKTVWNNHFNIHEVLRRYLDTRSDERKKQTADVLASFANYIGSFTQDWVKYIHPSENLTDFEINEIYKWVVLSAMNESMNKDGQFYADKVPTEDARQEVAEFMKLFFILTLENAETYVLNYSKTPEEIRRSIDARLALERAAMVQRIDKAHDRQVAMMMKKFGIGDWNFAGTFEDVINQATAFGLAGQRKETRDEAYGLGSGRAEGPDGVSRAELAEYD